ncbi:MAG: hypothetical protein HRT47_09600 [Candidatus Caenarcaniphilales bacterium]|nr:hypothetical protein [Candidatus Caenarcaniphilales bacterium]
MKKSFSWLLILLVLLSYSCSGNDVRSKYDISHLPVGPIQYQALENWELGTPENFMRLEQFQISENSELAVYFLPGSAGTVDENIARWKNQFMANQSKKELLLEQYNFKAIPLTEFYMEGDFKKSSNPFNPGAKKEILDAYAMYAIVAEVEEGKWFFKALGPKDEMSSARPEIEQFIETFKI